MEQKYTLSNNVFDYFKKRYILKLNFDDFLDNSYCQKNP